MSRNSNYTKKKRKSNKGRLEYSVLSTMIYCIKFPVWECLNVGTVPTYKMHNVGTVPMFKMHNVGIVPMFKIHNIGTPKMCDLCLELEFGLYGKNR